MGGNTHTKKIKFKPCKDEGIEEEDEGIEEEEGEQD